MKKLTLLFAALFIAAMSFAQTTWYLCGSMNGWSVGNSTYKLVDNELTINLAAGEYEFKLNNGSWAQELNYSHVDHDCSTAELKGSGTSNITLTIAEQQDVTFSVTAKTKVCVKAVSGEIENVYVVAGDAALMGVEWNGTASQNQMTVVDGVGTLVKENVSLAAGSYGFKIVRNGSAWIPDGSDNNNILTIAETAVYNVTFTHVIGTQTATAVAAKVDGGEVVIPNKTYYLAGDFCGWNAFNPDYVLVGNKITVELGAGSYQFKITDGTWDNPLNYDNLGECSNITLTSEDGNNKNIGFVLTEASDVTISLTEDLKICVNAVKHEGEIEPKPVDTDYYLFGYINGADYGCEGDYQNMGEYKFVDGKLTTTFTADSYVAVKTTNNANWYMFKEYVSTTSGILYNTTTGSSEKMFVPGKEVVNFTLKVNSDNTLLLSYTTSGVPSGIENVRVELDLNAPMFNVLGQEVNAQYKGVVIQNGQKFIVK